MVSFHAIFVGVVGGGGQGAGLLVKWFSKKQLYYLHTRVGYIYRGKGR